jgi:hypothetical protein
LIALIEGYSRGSIQSKPLLKRGVAGIFLILDSISLFTAAVPYGANWIDAPDFRFHIDNLFLSSVLILFSLGLAIWWIWDNKKPLLLGLIIGVVASTLSGTHISGFLVRSFGQDLSYDQLGRVLRNYLPQNELDQTVLIGDNNTAMERALFGSLSGGALPILAPETGYDLAGLPFGTRWVVKVGEPGVVGLNEPIVSGSDYSFYSLDSANSLTPRVKGEYLITESCTQSDSPDWSCGSLTEIKLHDRALKNARIDMLIEVSERAAGSELEFTLGDSSLSRTLPRGLFSLSLGFNNSSPSDALTIGSSIPELPTELTDARFVKVVSIIEKR